MSEDTTRLARFASNLAATWPARTAFAVSRIVEQSRSDGDTTYSVDVTHTVRGHVFNHWHMWLTDAEQPQHTSHARDRAERLRSFLVIELRRLFKRVEAL